MVVRSFILLLCVAVAGCAPPGDGSAAPGDRTDMPQRIVSLDYCADQYVVRFAPREAIAALSPDSTKPFSYMRAEAEGLPRVRAVAEDVLALQPDLIVRAYGGGPNATAFFETAGVPVLSVGWAGDLDGIKVVTQSMADGLGAPEAGAALVDELDARLAVIAARAPGGHEVLYLTPGGVTTGPGSLVDEMITAAGHTNFETRPGWHPLPLERLAGEHPDLTADAAFDSHVSPWSAARHPIARTVARADAVPLEGAWTACGGWFLINAIEALALSDAGSDAP